MRNRTTTTKLCLFQLRESSAGKIHMLSTPRLSKKNPFKQNRKQGVWCFLSIKLPLKLHQLIEFVFSNDLIYWAPHRPVFRGVLRNPPRGLSGPEQVPVKRQSPSIARDVRISISWKMKEICFYTEFNKTKTSGNSCSKDWLKYMYKQKQTLIQACWITYSETVYRIGLHR